MTVLSLARSFLFLPADRLERLPKALASGAHALVIDLEDAVAPAQKSAAREAVISTWPSLPPELRARLVLRINAVGSPFHATDAELLHELQGLGAVMPAKAEAPTELESLSECFPALQWFPLIESAEGLSQIDAIARLPRVVRLAFGHLDFQGDLGMTCDADDEPELTSVRLAFVITSRRANIAAPVDGVTTALHDQSRLDTDTRRARRLGFGAKLCIHPNQIVTVNRALGPTDAEREWAIRVLQAAVAQGEGAFRFEGAMVDAPVLTRARRFAQDINSQEQP